MKPPSERLWALVLAGGDGTRLQPLTRLIAGAPIPKQYCRIMGNRSLLPRHLVVARADDLGWSDWGTPEAIERTLATLGIVPPWHGPQLATA